MLPVFLRLDPKRSFMLKMKSARKRVIALAMMTG